METAQQQNQLFNTNLFKARYFLFLSIFRIFRSSKDIAVHWIGKAFAI